MVLKVVINLMLQLAPDQFIKAKERWREQGKRKLSGESLIPLVLAVTTIAVMNVFACMVETTCNPILALHERTSLARESAALI